MWLGDDDIIDLASKYHDKQSADSRKMASEINIDDYKDDNIILVDIKQKTPLTGLVANKLLAEFQRPLFVLRLKGGQYAGSMRAVGVDNFLEIANGTGRCLCQGHPNASGAFIDETDFELFKRDIEECLRYYEFSIEVKRLSESSDIIPVIFSERFPSNCSKEILASLSVLALITSITASA